LGVYYQHICGIYEMITYPVAPESRWATWSISQAEILKHNKPWPRHDGGPIVGQDPDIVPLLEIDVPPPAYDDQTHRIERGTPTVNVSENEHRHDWDIVLLTQEELDANAEDTANDVEDALWASRYEVFNDVNATNQQIQKAIAHLIKKVHNLP
jgi:hypothetical protein